MLGRDALFRISLRIGAGLLGLAFALLALKPIDLVGAVVNVPGDFWNDERVLRARVCGVVFSVLWWLLAVFPGGQRENKRRVASGGGRKYGAGDWCVLLFLLLASTVVRWRFIHVPLDYDEAYSFLNYARHGVVEALAKFDSTNNHPLNSLFMAIAYRLGGPYEPWLRLHVFVAGSAVAPLMYLACAGCGERVAGALAGLLVTLSPVFIEYSVNARGYALLALANALILCAATAGARPGWLASGTVLGIWALPSAVMALPGLIVWLWRAQERGARLRATCRFLLVVVAIGGLIYLPGFIAMGSHAARNPFVLPLSTGRWLLRFPLALLEAAALPIVPVPYDGIAAKLSSPDQLWQWLAHPESLASLFVGGVVLMALVYARGQLASFSRTVFLGVVAYCILFRLAPPPRVLFPFLVFELVLVGVWARAAVQRLASVAGWGTRFQVRLPFLCIVLGIVGIALHWPRPMASSVARYGWRLHVPTVARQVGERCRRVCCVVASLPADVPLRFYLWRDGIAYRWGVHEEVCADRYLVWLGQGTPDAAKLQNDPVLRPFAGDIVAADLDLLGLFGPLRLYEVKVFEEKPQRGGGTGQDTTEGGRENRDTMDTRVTAVVFTVCSR